MPRRTLSPDNVDGDQPEVAMPDPELTANTFKPSPKSSDSAARANVRHPAIQSGLEITPSPEGVKVAAGSLELNGNEIAVEGVILEVKSPPSLPVKGQAIRLSKAPFDEWKSRTLLAGQPLGMKK